MGPRFTLKKCWWSNHNHPYLWAAHCSLVVKRVQSLLNITFALIFSKTFARGDTLKSIWGCRNLGAWLACPLKSFPADFFFFPVLLHKIPISNSLQLVFAVRYDGHSHQIIIILVHSPLFVCVWCLTFCLPYGRHWFGNTPSDPPDRLTVLMAVPHITVLHFNPLMCGIN